MPTYRPITPADLIEHCADVAAGEPGRRIIVVDGADAADPDRFAQAITETLTSRGRAAAVVAMNDYLRPASLRFEYGHTDTESYRTIWFDHDAVRREVIDALHNRGEWLPRLWNAVRDRSFRDTARSATADQVVVLSGPLLLGSGLDADVTIALRLSEGALRRATPAAELFTIPALLDHARNGPSADVEIRYDHPDRPAIAER
ncbi:hypothetical protein AAFP35_10320 [Gordonia sp. CPCC 206044]|uniref:hypothetical protein n=1 Tax=Gordonia sp. CPCC 206044 TaxID=3140793 RepID=UPI003AF3586D